MRAITRVRERSGSSRAMPCTSVTDCAKSAVASRKPTVSAPLRPSAAAMPTRGSPHSLPPTAAPPVVTAVRYCRSRIWMTSAGLASGWRRARRSRARPPRTLHGDDAVEHLGPPRGVLGCGGAVVAGVGLDRGGRHRHDRPVVVLSGHDAERTPTRWELRTRRMPRAPARGRAGRRHRHGTPARRSFARKRSGSIRSAQTTRTTVRTSGNDRMKSSRCFSCQCAAGGVRTVAVLRPARRPRRRRPGPGTRSRRLPSGLPRG